MEELDLDLVAALGLPSPVEGVTREMLGKVGWVSGLLGRQIKLRIVPKCTAHLLLSIPDIESSPRGLSGGANGFA